MVNLKNPSILFLGLTHIGQIYSTSWLSKIGSCAVHDFDIKNLKNFKKKKFTIEEPELNKISLKKKFKYLNNNKHVKKYDIIFFTYDTPINIKDGKPNLKLIEKYLKKLLSLNLKDNCTIFFTSQVYPGFTDRFVKKFSKNKKINFIYMVDTLKMGQALNNFLYPEQLIFGGNKKHKKLINKVFKKFKCKKYLFKIEEAETIKISINLFLFFSVSFANMMDGLARYRGINFSKIITTLKNDKRIGKYAYINPSLGISGGHLERDFFYFKKISKNKLSNQIMNKMFEINNQRKNILIEEIKKYKKKKLKILIMGISYKNSSYSITNSIFSNLINNKKFNCKVFDDHFAIKDLPKNKIIKNIEEFKKFNFFIYNYSTAKNAKILRKFLKINKSKYLINISLKKNNFFTEPNCKNIFENNN